MIGRKVHNLHKNKEILFIRKQQNMLLIFNRMAEEYLESFNHDKSRGFTLLELLVVITILAILAGAALPYVQNYVKESRIAKAKADLEEIKKALAIYETREGTYNRTDVSLLTGKYLNNPPIDPWGKAYVVATESGIVYSSGPDRINGNYDDISVNYQPPLALVQVKWIDANQSGAVDTQNVPDYLQLYFSRQVSATSPAVLTPASANAYFSWTSGSDISTSLDWANFKLESAGNLITVPLANGVSNCFGPGSDTLRVSDGSGILDMAPTPGRCISDQEVYIVSR